MTQQKHHIFLIPGFLGIESLGELTYFAHVRDLLVLEFRRLGLPVEIHAVRNFATSSVRKRTLRLLETILEHAGDGHAPLHLIAHSTGGLDARLLCTPRANLGAEAKVESVAARVRSIVTVGCPHRGTPLASFFTTRFGAQMLSMLSLGTIYLLRYGQMPLSMMLRMAALFVRLHTKYGSLEHSIAQQMAEDVLGDLSPERRTELTELFTDIAKDQALMPQLMPESMDVFEAAVDDRGTIRCGSVVSGAPAAWLSGALRLGFDPYAQATHVLFEALRRLTSEMEAQYVPALTAAQRTQLVQGLGREPTPQDNDGIVPVLSQVWGELIHVVRADHFDAIGHFADAGLTPIHYDWLASGCGFDRTSFESLWAKVASFVAQGED